MRKLDTFDWLLLGLMVYHTFLSKLPTGEHLIATLLAIILIELRSNRK